MSQVPCREYNLERGPARSDFKLDTRKAFDTLNWDFFITTMKNMNFPVKFIHSACLCLHRLVWRGSFQREKKGFTKVIDLLSPFLSTIAMDGGSSFCE